MLYGEGDFDPSEAAPSAQGVRLSTGAVLGEISRDSQALLADLSTLADRRTFRGSAPVGERGDVSVLLWPEAAEGIASCRLSGDLASRQNGALGMVGPYHALYTGGQTSDGSPRTFAVDFTTGQTETVPSGLVRRLTPTVSRFGSNGLIAGGSDPESGLPIASAEIWNARAGDFAPSRIELSTGRAEHAAVTLVSGDVLLVGGRSDANATRTLEVVDAALGRARSQGVAQLELARRNPVALRLKNGDVMVLGGQDTRGNPVPDIEWISSDGSTRVRNRTPFLLAREVHALALEGGGALVVADGDDSARSNVWFVDAQGVATALASAPMPPAASFFLFAGIEDQALLYVQNAWFQFEPWRAREGFRALAEPPRSGPPSGALALATDDLGLVTWLEDRGTATTSGSARIAGLRFSPVRAIPGVVNPRGPSVRSAYGTTQRSMLTVDTDGFVPEKVPGEKLVFEEASGLRLAEGYGAVLAHYTYAGFSLTFEGDPEVIVRLESGAEFSATGSQCAALGGDSALPLVRSGQTLKRGSRSCAIPFANTERVQVLFRGRAGGSRVRNVMVRRGT